MSILNLAKKYVIDSQIFVSLMGTMMAGFFMLEQNIFRWPSLLLIFITYFSGYLYTKYQNRRKTFIKILVFNFICGILSFCLIVFNHNEIRLLKWAVIVIIGLLYNSFFLEKFIRKIPLLKVFYVGLVWGLVNSWLSFTEWNIQIFAITFLYITALVLPFDIRDMKTDTIVTFPQLIGVQNTKSLAYLMIFAATLVSTYFLKTDYSFAFLSSSIVAGILIYFADSKKSDAYFSFWIETCCGLCLLFLLILQYFIHLQ